MDANGLSGDENSDKVIEARLGTVQICLNPPERKAAATAGLNIVSNGSVNSQIWTCPNRPTFPQYEREFDQWVIRFQYFGGIATWQNYFLQEDLGDALQAKIAQLRAKP